MYSLSFEMGYHYYPNTIELADCFGGSFYFSYSSHKSRVIIPRTALLKSADENQVSSRIIGQGQSENCPNFFMAIKSFRFIIEHFYRCNFVAENRTAFDSKRNEMSFQRRYAIVGPSDGS